MLEPRLEIGMRHDDGDAETGVGLDLGGGLAWTHWESGVRGEFSGRGLLTHESAGFVNRGFSGALAWEPDPHGDRGPSVSLSHTIGAASTGGADALLGQRHLGWLGADGGEDELKARRLDLRAGYGLGLLADRYTATPAIGVELTGDRRTLSLGSRFEEARKTGPVFGLDVRAARSENLGDNGAGEQSLAVGAGWRLAGSGNGGYEVRIEGSRHEPDGSNTRHEAWFQIEARW